MGNPNTQDDGRRATGVYVARPGQRPPEALLDLLGALALQSSDAGLARAHVHLRHGHGVNRVPAATALALRWLAERAAYAAEDLDEAPEGVLAMVSDLSEMRDLLGLIVEEIQSDRDV